MGYLYEDFDMAATTQVAKTREEVAELGNHILRNQIEPRLAAEDMGKFVAIAVESGDYEIDKSDQKVMARILARYPLGRIWLARAGHPTAYKMRLR
jgi:hypothetical protein